MLLSGSRGGGGSLEDTRGHQNGSASGIIYGGGGGGSGVQGTVDKIFKIWFLVEKSMSFRSVYTLSLNTHRLTLRVLTKPKQGS